MLLSKVGSGSSTSLWGLIRCCFCLIILFLTKLIWISSFIYLMYEFALAIIVFDICVWMFLYGRVRVFPKLHLIKMHFIHKLHKFNKYLQQINVSAGELHVAIYILFRLPAAVATYKIIPKIFRKSCNKSIILLNSIRA